MMINNKHRVEPEDEGKKEGRKAGEVIFHDKRKRGAVSFTALFLFLVKYKCKCSGMIITIPKNKRVTI